MSFLYNKATKHTLTWGILQARAMTETSSTTFEDHLFRQKAAFRGLSLPYTEIANEE